MFRSMGSFTFRSTFETAAVGRSPNSMHGGSPALEDVTSNPGPRYTMATPTSCSTKPDWHAKKQYTKSVARGKQSLADLRSYKPRHKARPASPVGSPTVFCPKQSTKFTSIELLKAGEEPNPGPEKSLRKIRTVAGYIAAGQACQYDGAIIKAKRSQGRFVCGACYTLLGGSGLQQHPAVPSAPPVVYMTHQEEDMEAMGLGTPVTARSLEPVERPLSMCYGPGTSGWLPLPFVETPFIPPYHPTTTCYGPGTSNWHIPYPPPQPLEPVSYRDANRAASDAYVQAHDVGYPEPAGPTAPPPPPAVQPRPVDSGELLDGRRLTGPEAADMIERKFGGFRVAVENVKYEYRAERRAVTNRNVKETKQDFVVQRISFHLRTYGWFTLLALTLPCWFAGIAHALRGELIVCPFETVLTLAGVGELMMCLLLWTLRRAPESKNRVVRYLPRVLLVLYGQALAHFIAYQTVVTVFAVTVLVCATFYLGLHFMSSIRRGRAVMVLVPVIALFTVAFPWIVAAHYVADFLFRLAFALVELYGLENAELFLCSWLYRLTKRDLIVCPHMVTCVMADYAAGTSAEVVAANTRSKLMRLATLPIPDVAYQQLMAGSELAIYHLVQKEPFFAEGAIHLGSPL